MAGAGFEVFNDDGSLRNGITDFLGRILGTARVTGRGGVMSWPYPGVIGRRCVYAISNTPPQDNVFSYAYAKLRADNVTIDYGLEGDRAAMTIMFMVY